jgi:cyclase
MLKKRVIFTLLYCNGEFMLSRNFRLQKVGNLRWLKKNYNFSKIAFSIDELIILDVSREKHDQDKFCEHVKSLTEECFIPIAAGGGIRDVEYARKLLRSGADKIVINSLAAINTKSINKIASEFGQQSIVLSVDVRHAEGDYSVWTENGSKEQMVSLTQYLENLNNFPIGELYLNSIDNDGTGQGYDFTLLQYLPDNLSMPVILAGGAGRHEHFAEGLNNEKVDAVATAHLFNFVGDGLARARNNLLEKGFKLAIWDISKANILHNSFLR